MPQKPKPQKPEEEKKKNPRKIHDIDVKPSENVVAVDTAK